MEIDEKEYIYDREELRVLEINNDERTDVSSVNIDTKEKSCEDAIEELMVCEVMDDSIIMATQFLLATDKKAKYLFLLSKRS